MTNNIAQPVSRSEFARMCGVSPAAITKALATILADAAYGKKIDVAHPAAVEYVEMKAQGKRMRAGGNKPAVKKTVPKKKATAAKKKAAPKKKPAKKPAAEKPVTINQTIVRGRAAANQSRKVGPPPKPIDHIPRDLRKFLDMPMREFVERFGTDGRMKEWLDGTGKIEQIEAARMKHAAIRGELVSKLLVQKGVMEPINTFLIRILTDGAKTMSNRIGAKVRAGATDAEVELEIRKQIERFLKPMKAKIKKAIGDV